MDMKGGRTQQGEGHEGRKVMKGRRTRREGGHDGRKDRNRGRRGRGTTDCPNKGKEIAK
jgi:hypothetical protein